MLRIGADRFRRSGSRPHLPQPPLRRPRDGDRLEGGAFSFSARRIGGGGGGNTAIGKLCSGAFTVNAGADVGPLYFAKGPYLIYIPIKSAITCRRASVLFTRFLAAPGGALPDPWQVKTQTATFFKPAHPLRSAFRIEPANGVS